MDPALVASLRKNLESTPSAELEQACAGGERMGRIPEELEAMRQILAERRARGQRAAIALLSAGVVGPLGAAGMWWQAGFSPLVLLVGLVCAALAFASWYIPDLIPRA